MNIIEIQKQLIEVQSALINLNFRLIKKLVSEDVEILKEVITLERKMQMLMQEESTTEELPQPVKPESKPMDDLPPGINYRKEIEADKAKKEPAKNLSAELDI